MTRVQFRVLYREFLFRVVDLELLAQDGDTSKLLGQFAALLIFCSLWLTPVAGLAGAVGGRNPMVGMMARWVAQHFLIATTMLAVGLFAVMSWESTFPDRRDVLVLSPLPIRARTMLGAKVAAVATALSITVLALNSLTGVFLPLSYGASSGVVSAIRAFAAWWVTQLAAGLFIFCAVLAVQGLAQLLPRQVFLRLSSWLQTSFFVVMVTVYFLQPPFSEIRDLLANQRALRWVPSYWFFALFQKLNGSALPQLDFLVRRAWAGLLIATAGAAAAYLICYLRTLRKIAEDPDILPVRRGLHWLPPFGDSLETAVAHFSVRTLLRSRSHRVVLTFYLGIGLGLAMYVSHLPEVYHRASGFGEWYGLNAPLLVASALITCAAIVGTRVVFAMPLQVRANWIFRMMPRAGIARCLSATRRSLYTLSLAPIWMSCAAVFFYLWPWRVAAEHLALLAVLGVFVAEVTLLQFHKIPFTCSYLPGKTRFNMALVYLALFLLVTQWAVDREMAALADLVLYAKTLGLLLAAAVLARRRTSSRSHAEEGQVHFEETPDAVLFCLDLHKDGATILQ
jgi:hypothetical protein